MVRDGAARKVLVTAITAVVASNKGERNRANGECLIVHVGAPVWINDIHRAERAKWSSRLLKKGV
jgi:hypothetical protein